MEKLQVGLRLLAIGRAESAKDYLLEAGIASDRIFLLEPGTIKPDKNEQEVKANRVNFRLK